MHNEAHMSMAVVYFVAPRSSSGARYHKVTTSCVYCPIGDPYLRNSTAGERVRTTRL
jgi:hypothetical protein